jgi:hypothetical protein
MFGVSAYGASLWGSGAIGALAARDRTKMGKMTFIASFLMSIYNKYVRAKARTSKFFKERIRRRLVSAPRTDTEKPGCWSSWQLGVAPVTQSGLTNWHITKTVIDNRLHSRTSFTRLYTEDILRKAMLLTVGTYKHRDIIKSIRLISSYVRVRKYVRRLRKARRT